MGGAGGGGVCTVIFVSNPTVVLCCAGVGVLTIFHVCFSVSLVFQVCFEDVLRKFQRRFKSAPMHGSYCSFPSRRTACLDKSMN